MHTALKPRASQKHGIRQDQGTILVDRVEQFALLKRATPEELSSLKEFFYVLINKANREQRRRISVALARNIYAPRSILIFLAMDDVDVASPVLLFSQSLTDKDLCNVISKTTIEYCRIIARRDNISLDAIHGLLDKDDREGTVLNILQKNRSIAHDLHTALKNRPAAIPASFPAMVSLSRSATEKTAPETANHGSRDLSDKLLKLANTGGKLGKKPQGAEKTPLDPAARDALGNSLILAARNRKHGEIAALVCSACGLSTKHTREYIDQENVGTFACLLRVLDMTRVTAARILLLVFPKLGRDENVLADVLLRYDRLEKISLLAFFKSVDFNFDHQTRHDRLVSQADRFSKLLESRRSSILETPDTPLAETRKKLKISA